MQEKTERRPGRPPNTGRHQAMDAIRIVQIADMKLQSPHQPLASIIRGIIDSSDTGGVRRLQRAYKAQEKILIASARQRRQQQQIQETVEKAAIFASNVGLFVQAVAIKLDAWVRSPEGQRLVERYERFVKALNTPEARRMITNLSSHKPLQISTQYRS